ncbi:MAG TPA: B12-binding domain-containing radical SAM protein [Deltaproteobacteria bacterium]|nr:B12-binding domain-containing radical SAM protein [Deltaproteobacteria bacterium]
MKKLLLISPLTSRSLLGADFYFRMPTLGLLKVAAATPEVWSVRIVEHQVEPLDLDQPVDLVGITAMTPAADRAYEIADAFRARGVKVVMGGIHASMLPEEALAHCDAVVVGEAESQWHGLLSDFLQGRMKAIYRQGMFPGLAGMRDADWSLYDGKGYLPMHCVETSRGCPHGCDFCSVTNYFGGRYRTRPVEDVEREVRSLRPFEGRFILKNVVFFVDDNIAGNRTHARELLTRMIPYRLKWLGQASTTIAGDDELLDLCRRSGCMGLLIGFETLSRENLANVRKGFNRPENYIDVIRKIHDHGLGVSGAFVFGLDGDDAGVFDRTYDFVQKAKLESPYFSILTPYPGTRMFTRLQGEGRIIDRDWSKYNTNYVVYRPVGMTPDELFDGYYRLQNAVYSFPAIARRLLGSTSKMNFWLPMNYGFRRSIKRLTERAMAERDGAAGSQLQSTGG